MDDGYMDGWVERVGDGRPDLSRFISAYVPGEGLVEMM